MTEALYTILKPFHDFMMSAPGFPWFLLYFALAFIPACLVHELGHGIAACRLIPGAVKIVVGAGPTLAAFRIGRLRVDLHLWPSLKKVDGYTLYDTSKATLGAVFLIAIAGPIASLIGGVGSALLFSAAPDSGVLHDFLWAVTFDGFGAVVLCGLPYTLEDPDGRTYPTDGRIALDVLKAASARAHT